MIRFGTGTENPLLNANNLDQLLIINSGTSVAIQAAQGTKRLVKDCVRAQQVVIMPVTRSSDVVDIIRDKLNVLELNPILRRATPYFLDTTDVGFLDYGPIERDLVLLSMFSMIALLNQPNPRTKIIVFIADDSKTIPKLVPYFYDTPYIIKGTGLELLSGGLKNEGPTMDGDTDPSLSNDVVDKEEVKKNSEKEKEDENSGNSNKDKMLLEDPDDVKESKIIFKAKPKPWDKNKNRR